MAYQCEYDEDYGVWKVQGKGGTREYADMGIALGFGDPTDQKNKHHSAVAGGISKIGSVDILDGFSGPWNEVRQAATNFKDIFLIQRIITPSKPESLIWALDSHDGLLEYRKKKGKYTNREYYENPPETWPFFRSYDTEAYQELAPPEVEDDIETACVRFEDLTSTGRVRIPQRTWKGLHHATKQPLEEGIRTSVLRAAVYLTFALIESWEHRPRGEVKREQRQGEYGNIM